MPSSVCDEITAGMFCRENCASRYALEPSPALQRSGVLLATSFMSRLAKKVENVTHL